ncbi:MAG: hypothetical protein CGW95_13390 [Phenylobacterium zucineum]|nr:MAG: hypothetical protein CGW95_13390 [Phenylobacterium zucineum]
MSLFSSRRLARALSIPLVALMPIGAPLYGATAQAAEPTPIIDLMLTVHVQKHHRGSVIVGVFDNNASYTAGEKPAGSCRIDVSASVERCMVRGLKAGTYGIKAFHDLNGNGKLEMNVFGIPTEPVAFSNNAKINMRAPNWSELKIFVDPQNVVQNIFID